MYGALIFLQITKEICQLTTDKIIGQRMLKCNLDVGSNLIGPSEGLEFPHNWADLCPIRFSQTKT